MLAIMLSMEGFLVHWQLLQNNRLPDLMCFILKNGGLHNETMDHYDRVTGNIADFCYCLSLRQ